MLFAVSLVMYDVRSLVFARAKTVEEACKLADLGFEYFGTIDGTHIYRKRK